MRDLNIRVWGLGFEARGLRFGVLGFGVRVWDLGLRSLGSGVWGLKIEG